MSYQYIFSIYNGLAKIRIRTNFELMERLEINEVYSTIPTCMLVENCYNDCDSEIDICYSDINKFEYNEDFSHFTICCKENNFYSPDITFLMLCIFASKLQRYDYYMVHSSAISLEDKGIIFVGPSGSGKTNVSLFLTKKYDASFVSGDMTLLKYDEDTKKIFLVGGTKELTAFDNIVESLFGISDFNGFNRVNGKVILEKSFLKRNNVNFTKKNCELTMIVNIRGGLNSYVKKNYDIAENIIKVTGMLSEWIRTYSNYCVSTGHFFPDFDTKILRSRRNMMVQDMAQIHQASFYGQYDLVAEEIYKIFISEFK